MMVQERNETEYYTPKMLSKKLNCHVETIYDYIATAGLPAMRIKSRYFIPVSAFMEWQKRHLNEVG